MARVRRARLRGHYAGMGDLGFSAGQGISASAPIAGAVTTSFLASSATLGSFAGPIGAAVGAIVGIVGALFAAHSARAKGAKNENEAVNAFLPAFDQALQAVFQQANAGTISEQDAISGCEAILAQWWGNIGPYQSGPGRADKSGNGRSCGQVNTSDPCSGMLSGPKCDKSCTAGCCVGCQDLVPSIAQAITAFQNGGGSVKVCTVYGSKYGAQQRNGYTLTYKRPAATSGVGGLSDLISGSSGGGLPSWVLLAGLGVGAVLIAKGGL